MNQESPLPPSKTPRRSETGTFDPFDFAMVENLRPRDVRKRPRRAHPGAVRRRAPGRALEPPTEALSSGRPGPLSTDSSRTVGEGRDVSTGPARASMCSRPILTRDASEGMAPDPREAFGLEHLGLEGWRGDGWTWRHTSRATGWSERSLTD